jgi:hypothetical protein
LPFRLASLTSLGLVLERFVVKEVLFPCRKNKIRAAIGARQGPILELCHGLYSRENGAGAYCEAPAPCLLLHFPPALFPVPFASQCLLDPFLLARLQVKGVPFDLFDDVLGLYLTLEAAEGIFDGFALLNLHFCQLEIHPQTDH